MFLPPFFVSLSLCLSFSLSLLEDAIAPRGASGKGNLFAVPVMEGCSEKLEEKVTKTEGRATLRLKNNGLAAVEEIVKIRYTYMCTVKPLSRVHHGDIAMG